MIRQASGDRHELRSEFAVGSTIVSTLDGQDAVLKTTTPRSAPQISEDFSETMDELLDIARATESRRHGPARRGRH